MISTAFNLRDDETEKQSNYLTDKFKGKLPFIQKMSYLTSYGINTDDQNHEEQMAKTTIPFREKGRPPEQLIIPRINETAGRAVCLQKWECYVQTILDDTFIARIIDLTSESPDEEAEFFIADISDEDMDLLKPGAVFYWHIGYIISSSGTRSRASTIRFRRLPVWEKEDIEAATKEAERLRRIFANG
jgi:hypothetical protein